MKVVVLVVVPPAVVNEIVPLIEPGITIATTAVPVFEITIAAVPPILTPVGLESPVPLIVTKVPTEPLEGLKDVMAGGWANAVNVSSTISSAGRLMSL